MNSYNQDLFKKGPKKGPEKGPESTGRRTEKQEEIDERVSKVFEMIKNNPEVSRAELVSSLSLSDKQIKLAIEKLKRSGRIQREGSARSGRWIVIT